MRIISFLIIFLFLSFNQSFATTMLQMNLEEMTSNSDKIFRGELVETVGTKVSVGGGEVSAIIYKFRVDEVFKGQVDTVKGVQVVEVKMIGTLDKQRAGQRMIPGFPLYKVGDQYLLFVAPSGETGLTTTMGLGQGSFYIYTSGKQELAVNDYQNINLFKAPGSVSVMSADEEISSIEGGPLSYRELADQIKTLMAQ